MINFTMGPTSVGVKFKDIHRGCYLVQLARASLGQAHFGLSWASHSCNRQSLNLRLRPLGHLPFTHGEKKIGFACVDVTNTKATHVK